MDDFKRKWLDVSTMTLKLVSLIFWGQVVSIMSFGFFIIDFHAFKKLSICEFVKV